MKITPDLIDRLKDVASELQDRGLHAEATMLRYMIIDQQMWVQWRKTYADNVTEWHDEGWFHTYDPFLP